MVKLRDQAAKVKHRQPSKRVHHATTQRKKSRTARAAENGGSAVSDEDSNQDVTDDPEETELSSVDEDEETLRTKVLRQMLEDTGGEDLLNSGQINQAADHGVIEEVYCQNFMCHSKLRIKLGPLINFIIGHNGSGKSAVLTALTLCLGAKASVTNRGGSLKHFIKEGTDACMVSVKIKNRGEGAFQHDLYGDTITVERHFKRAGGSGFKLRNEDGRIISTKKADLEDMLDFLGLQLDNPMNVLSQDMARQFLNNSSPHDKYKFFLKGTQLEQLDRDYRTMNEYVDQIEIQLENRYRDIAHLRKRLQDAENKKKQADQAETITDKIKEYDRMHAWAQVKEQEDELAKAIEEVATLEEKLAQREQDAREKSERFDQANTSFESAKDLKTQFETDLQPAEEEKSRVKDEFDTNKKKLLEMQSTQRNIKSDLKAAQNRVKQAEESVRKEQDRIQQASGPAQAQKFEELREAEEEVEQRKRDEEGQGDKRALEDSRNEILAKKTAEESAIETATAKASEDKSTAERALQELRNEQRPRTRAYHESLQRLLQAIQRERGFREKPIGPLGYHVKLKNPDWSSVIESVFGGVLNAFVVTNAHDQGIMRKLTNNVGYHGDIYIGNPRPLDVTNNKADTKYDTLLDVLEIDHDIIRNLFIINQSAEKTVLIQARNEASDFISKRPRNVVIALAMDMNRRGAGHRFSYTANGSRMDPVAAWRGLARMQTNVEAQIAAQQSNIADAERRMKSDTQKLQRLNQELAEVNRSINSFNHRGRELRVARQEAEANVERIKQELDEFTIDAGTLDAHKSALEEATGDVQLAERSFEDSVNEKDVLNEQQRLLKAELDKAQAVVTEFRTKIDKIDEAIRKKQALRATALSEKNQAMDKVQDTKEDKVKAEEQRDVLDARVKEWIREAENVCERREIEPGMTPEKIEKKIQALEKQRHDRERQLGGTREQIVQQWVAANEAWDVARKEHNSLKGVAKLLKDTYINRIKAWRKFRHHIMVRAKIMFSLLLDQRKFKGRLLADHQTRSLDISVRTCLTT
ncbi:hypothetical protein BDZ85DRAFT_36369 [Elsinoe ampelina]|uniref:Rad50/SbcC-type AAA domain-containing protein n=1 Tax=Elsinoe ampelina TaxID=302913 RepID=A0A6A6G2L7_9PEZI|nr:hypothetical protein BDZ85DRAFT_36369 [Elsinoe ampelina]